jgi:phosphoglycolate phosphatase
LGSFAELVGQDDAESAIQHYRDRFGDVGYRENELYPGITDVLTALNEHDVRLFVATSKPTFYARKIIEHFGLSSYFEDVCGSELDGTRADKTDLLAWIVAEKGLEPTSTAMIGDRRHDIIGARNNAIDSIAVLYGYGSRQELSEAGAAHFCARPSDLARVLAAL